MAISLTKTSLFQVVRRQDIRGVTAWCNLLVAAGMAAVGLAINSSATVVASMLVSPLQLGDPAILQPLCLVRKPGPKVMRFPSVKSTVFLGAPWLGSSTVPTARMSPIIQLSFALIDSVLRSVPWRNKEKRNPLRLKASTTTTTYNIYIYILQYLGMFLIFLCFHCSFLYVFLLGSSHISWKIPHRGCPSCYPMPRKEASWLTPFVISSWPCWDVLRWACCSVQPSSWRRRGTAGWNVIEVIVWLTWLHQNQCQRRICPKTIQNWGVFFLYVNYMGTSWYI